MSGEPSEQLVDEDAQGPPASTTCHARPIHAVKIHAINRECTSKGIGRQGIGIVLTHRNSFRKSLYPYIRGVEGTAD